MRSFYWAFMRPEDPKGTLRMFLLRASGHSQGVEELHPIQAPCPLSLWQDSAQLPGSLTVRTFITSGGNAHSHLSGCCRTPSQSTQTSLASPSLGSFSLESPTGATQQAGPSIGGQDCLSLLEGVDLGTRSLVSSFLVKKTN